MTTHNDYARIKGKLSIQLGDLQQQIEQAQGHVAELQDELASIGQNKAKIQQEQAIHQGEAVRLGHLVRLAEQEAQMAEGTSLESAKRAQVERLQAELVTATATLEGMLRAYAHDSEQERETQSEIHALSQSIAQMQSRYAELGATRQRFDAEHFSVTRDAHLKSIMRIDEELTTSRAYQERLEAQRDAAVRQMALALTEWPAQAVETLAAVGQLPEPPSVIAMKQRYEHFSYLEEHASQLSRDVWPILSKPINVGYLADYGGRAAYEEQRRRIVSDVGPAYLTPYPAELQMITNEFSSMEGFLAQAGQLRRQAAQQLLEEVQATGLVEKGA